MKKTILILITALIGGTLSFGMPSGAILDEITGIWLGKLKPTEQLELRIAFEIKKTESGQLSAFMNILEQKAMNIPMDGISFKGDTIRIQFIAGNIEFSGIYQKEPQRLEGSFAQAGKAFPLVLTKVDELPKAVIRPQTPQPPFPYKEEEILIENKVAGVNLSGTLTIPNSGKPNPAVILIAGSGKNDRNGTKMGHFLLLADYLTRRGYVVLRSDKRGVGKSTGDYAAATTEDFASDIQAAVEFLKTRPEVDARSVGLIGHSEGALIAPMVASSRKDISFLVLMGGVGLRGDELLLLQTRKLTGATGASPDAIEEQVNQFRNYYSIIHEKIEDTAKINRIRKVNPEVSDATVKMLMKPWISWFTACDPATYLKKVKCPVLAVTGSKDLQCSPEENLKGIESALKAGKNRHYTTRTLPGLNHLFQTAQSGSPLEYEKIDEIIAPAALEFIAEWMGKQD
jgi:pimeloyl-ACP methyl ester carboxylesterase